MQPVFRTDNFEKEIKGFHYKFQSNKHNSGMQTLLLKWQMSNVIFRHAELQKLSEINRYYGPLKRQIIYISAYGMQFCTAT